MREAIAAYQAQQNQANIDAIVRDFHLQFKPRPRLKVSEWADRFRHLSPESSAEPGKWQTSRTPYLKQIMDAVNDPSIHTIVVMTCSQIGKSEALNNILFYYAHQDPCAMLMIQPTLTDAEDYSKSRLAPSIRDSSELRVIFGEEKSRKSNSTIMKKSFSGGRLVLVGANSPSGLSSKPIRVVLADEIDRYEATKEGSPVRLAMKRTSTFFNRKMILTSTPSIGGLSEVESWYKLSDMRKYFVPCAECGEHILLKWDQVMWDKDSDGRHLTETAKYCCQECGSLLNDYQINEMVQLGEWKATAPFSGIAGFGEFPELYSPWKRMSETVKEFLDVKNDTDSLRVWINTSLGQVWEDKNEKLDYNEIYERREVYNLVVPREACFITCSVDTQGDRLEALVIAWGADEEAWAIEHRIFYGDPGIVTRDLSKTDVNQLTFDQVSDFDAQSQAKGVWKELDDFLLTTYEHESGELMRIGITVIDSGGHHTDQVYAFVRLRERRGVYAIKGDSNRGKPVIDRPSRKNKGKIQLFNIGVFAGKESIQSRLKKQRPGPGYFHFPDRFDKEFFEQLVSEKKVTKEVRGQKVVEWVKTRQRNEAFDLMVYNFAALRIRFQVRELLNLYSKKFQDKIAEKRQDKEKPKAEEIRNSQKRKPGGFVKNW